jgi:hypothetical protein
LFAEPDEGLVVRDPHDAVALGAAVADMADPNRLPARKLAATAAGRRWTFEDHYRRLLAVFEEVVARKRSKPLAA